MISGRILNPDKVERWWGIILPKVAPLLYNNGGPIIMVQIENEFGSYGDDQAYLHHLVKLARGYLGDEVILYTTDGGTRETLEKGTIRGDAVFSAVDFSTGERPWPIFNLQKEFNVPGKSPPLSAEFYTGWLTHWGENMATTDAESTAAALSEILAGKGSAVLYMAHGGTNFGFYNGANTGDNVLDYKPDLTSYDYDAPIKESGDIDNAKYEAIRRAIQHYSGALLPSVPSNNEKIAYGPIRLQKSAFLFDMLRMIDHIDVVISKEPLPMESLDQSFGFLLYATEYVAKDNADGNVLFIPEVHDRAQVFLSCSSKTKGMRPTSVGIIERWSNRRLSLPNTRCDSSTLYILVENMGRINYGRDLFDRKGILSSVYLDDNVLYGWKMIPIPFNNLNEIPRVHSFSQIAHSGLRKTVASGGLETKSENISSEPTLYTGYFDVEKMNLRKDTFLSFAGWTKGIAFVNEFNLGRFWPVVGPQCTLYVPAPILRLGKNVLVILELESPNGEVVVHSVDRPDFTCGSSKSNLSQAFKPPTLSSKSNFT